MTGDSDKDGKGTVKIEEDSSSDTSDMSDDDMPTPSNSSAMLPGAIHQNLHRHTSDRGIFRHLHTNTIEMCVRMQHK